MALPAQLVKSETILRQKKLDVLQSSDRHKLTTKYDNYNTRIKSFSFQNEFRSLEFVFKTPEIFLLQKNYVQKIFGAKFFLDRIILLKIAPKMFFFFNLEQYIFVLIIRYFNHT